MSKKDQTWKIGEGAAKEYLENKGYEIIERNYRTRYLEIDLVAQKDNVLALVEVRTKTSGDFVTPEESITPKKLKKLYWNAEAYVSAKKWKGDYRVDAICIELGLDDKIKRLEHYQGI
ncbi:MAG: YraN family protein [Patescibacteria group bacterium]